MRDPRNTSDSAVTMLIEGYCRDFIQLASSLAQTLEQVTMRRAPLGRSRASLERVQSGMHDLSEAIAVMLKDVPAAESAVPEAIRDGGSGACVFQGETSSMPLPSVFQFLGRMHKTGTLIVELPGEKLSFAFLEGRLEGCTTDRFHPGETVGELLVELGFADDARVLEARAHGEPGAELGEVLVRSGLVTATQLTQARTLVVKRRMRRVAKTKAAGYAFLEGAAQDRTVAVD